MKIVVISGSSRPNSQSLKVAHWLTDYLESKLSDVSVHPFSMDALDITFDPNEFWSGEGEKTKLMNSVYSRFEEADAFVIVTPEWGGGVPPKLRQLILMSGSSMSHKPVLTIGVSATRTGGIRPIEELKHATKNTRFVIIPDPVVINEVESILNGDSKADTNTEHEEYIVGKLGYSVKVLEQYAKALKQVRESGIIDYEAHPHGM